jgi:O-antigen/teichoic acid export membrane protein
MCLALITLNESEGGAVQSLSSEEEAEEQILQQMSREANQNVYGQFVGPPHRLTLPFYVKPYTNDDSSSARREWISALDTAMMAAIQPQVMGLPQRDVLAQVLVEDIAERGTMILPVLTKDTGKEGQVDQHKDIALTARGAGIAGFANIMYNVLRYVTNVAMAHMVSPTIYGVFGEVITAVYLLGMLANLGFDTLLIYLLPTYRVKEERSLARGLVRFSTRISLITGFLLGTLLFVFAPVIAQEYYHAPSNDLILRELAPLIPLIAFGGIYSAGLQALKEIKLNVCVQLILSLITLVTLVAFYLLGWRAEALIYSAIAGYACSMLIGRMAFSKFVKRVTGDVAPRYKLRDWFGFALPALFSQQIFNIAITADILVLSIFATPAQAGIYIAASRISGLVNLPLAAVNVIFIPLMAEYHAKGKREQLESMVKLVTKWSLLLSLPVCLCCFVFHDAILGIFGAQYTAGWLVLVILCFGYLVNAGTGPVFQLLSVTRRLRLTSIDSVTQLILGVALSFFLIPRFNILGAALAAALASILVNVLCVIEVYWTMKLHPYRWDMCKPLLAGGVAALVGMLLQHSVHLQSGPGRFAFLEELGLIIPVILVYVVMMLLLRFSEEDRIAFNAILVRFSRQRPTIS